MEWFTASQSQTTAIALPGLPTFTNWPRTPSGAGIFGRTGRAVLIFSMLKVDRTSNWIPA
jgi:hypothetical protein